MQYEYSYHGMDKGFGQIQSESVNLSTFDFAFASASVGFDLIVTYRTAGKGISRGEVFSYGVMGRGFNLVSEFEPM